MLLLSSVRVKAKEKFPFITLAVKFSFMLIFALLFVIPLIKIVLLFVIVLFNGPKIVKGMHVSKITFSVVEFVLPK